MKNDKHKRSTKSSKAEAKQRNEQSALSTDNEIIRLVHELEVHQIELECRMKHYYWLRAADSTKQSELYDLLPSFYSIKGRCSRT
jgi:hypothetical protein